MSKAIIILDESEIYRTPERKRSESIFEMSKQAREMGCDLDYVVAYNNGWNDCLDKIDGGEEDE